MKKTLLITTFALISFNALAADVCIVKASSQAAVDFIKIDCTHKNYKTIEPKEDRTLAKARVIKHLIEQGFVVKTDDMLVRP